MTKDYGPKSPLPWRLRKTPKRGTRRAANWRRVYVGYTFPNSAWTVTEAPFRRIKRGRSKSWVTVRCGDCQREYERRLDHLIAGKSRRCLYCAPQIHKPWITRWESRTDDSVSLDLDEQNDDEDGV